MTLLQEHTNIIMDESSDANEEKKEAPEEGAPTKVRSPHPSSSLVTRPAHATPSSNQWEQLATGS